MDFGRSSGLSPLWWPAYSAPRRPLRQAMRAAEPVVAVATVWKARRLAADPSVRAAAMRRTPQPKLTPGQPAVVPALMAAYTSLSGAMVKLSDAAIAAFRACTRSHRPAGRSSKYHGRTGSGASPAGHTERAGFAELTTPPVACVADTMTKAASVYHDAIILRSQWSGE